MNSLCLLWINKISRCKYSKKHCWNDIFLLTRVIWYLYICAPTGTHINKSLFTCHGRNWAQLWDLERVGVLPRPSFEDTFYISVQLPKVPLGAVYLILKSPSLGIKRFSKAYRAVGLEKPWSEMWARCCCWSERGKWTCCNSKPWLDLPVI